MHSHDVQLHSTEVHNKITEHSNLPFFALECEALHVNFNLKGAMCSVGLWKQILFTK